MMGIIMISFFLGSLLLFWPFAFVFCFKDKKQGFISVLLLWIVGNTVLALATQAFSIFSYDVLAAAQVLAALAAARMAYRKKIPFQKPRVDWMLVAVLLIAGAGLWQVHGRYTGQISLATDQTASYQRVEAMHYPYPYFSDEWDTVA